MSAAEDKVRESLKRSVHKIDLVHAKNGGVVVHTKMCRKFLRLMHEHGEHGIKSIQVLPNFDNGAAPQQLPSGYRMIFDASKAPVIAEAYPTEALYAGTMAFRVPASELAASPLTTESGPTATVSELVSTLAAANNTLAEANSALADSYTGLFSVESCKNEDYEHEYWVVSRSVNPTLNEQFGEAVARTDRDESVTLLNLLEDTEQLRHQTHREQRTQRAAQLSAVLAAYHIDVSVERILTSTRHPLVDNTFNMLEADENGTDAALFCNAVPLYDSTLSGGVLLTNTMRLGPRILQGESLGRGEVGVAALDAFPSSVPTIVSPWKLSINGNVESMPGVIKLDAKCKRSAPNSPYTWNNSTRESHALLAKNLYHRINSPEWMAYQAAAGFDAKCSTTLRPLAVKMD